MDIIKVEGLSKSLKNRRVIDNISFSVEKGDIYGFLGQNGSGKTTTIRLLTKLIKADSGIIELNGFNLKKDFKKAIDRTGAIIEYPKFYNDLSGKCNLQLMANLIPNIKKDKVQEVLEAVGLKKRGKDKVKTYSLGMKQRLGIANSLLNDPELIILDEPTNGLDPQGMKEIRDMIFSLSKNKNISFFISTHLLNEVEQLCNKVAVLHLGKILAEGKVKDLLSKDYETLEIVTFDREKAKAIMIGIPFIIEVKDTNIGIEVKLDKSCSGELNNKLVTSGVNVDYIIPKKVSLEEYFLELVKGGKQLE